MTVHLDPSVSGIEPSKEAPRHINDWNGANVLANSRHARFYEALVKWAPRFSAAVDRAFNGDVGLSSSDFGEPVLPSKD
jgi:hypothetical protein